MGAIRDYLLSITPGFLADHKPFLTSLGDQADDIADKARQALRYIRLETAGTDSYDAHARNSSLYRIYRDTDATLLSYLRHRWDVWERSGTIDALTGATYSALTRLGYQHVTVVTKLDLLLASTPGFGDYSGFFYVDIDAPNGWRQNLWDGGSLWDDGELWDGVEPYPGALGDIKQAVRKFKPVGRSCRFVRIKIDGSWVPFPVAETWEHDANGVLDPAAPYVLSI